MPVAVRGSHSCVTRPRTAPLGTATQSMATTARRSRCPRSGWNSPTVPCGSIPHSARTAPTTEPTTGKGGGPAAPFTVCKARYPRMTTTHSFRALSQETSSSRPAAVPPQSGQTQAEQSLQRVIGHVRRHPDCHVGRGIGLDGYGLRPVTACQPADGGAYCVVAALPCSGHERLQEGNSGRQ